MRWKFKLLKVVQDWMSKTANMYKFKLNVNWTTRFRQDLVIWTKRWKRRRASWYWTMSRTLALEGHIGPCSYWMLMILDHVVDPGVGRSYWTLLILEADIQGYWYWTLQIFERRSLSAMWLWHCLMLSWSMVIFGVVVTCTVVVSLTSYQSHDQSMGIVTKRRIIWSSRSPS